MSFQYPQNLDKMDKLTLLAQIPLNQRYVERFSMNKATTLYHHVKKLTSEQMRTYFTQHNKAAFILRNQWQSFSYPELFDQVSEKQLFNLLPVHAKLIPYNLMNWPTRIYFFVRSIPLKQMPILFPYTKDSVKNRAAWILRRDRVKKHYVRTYQSDSSSQQFEEWPINPDFRGVRIIQSSPKRLQQPHIDVQSEQRYPDYPRQTQIILDDGEATTKANIEDSQSRAAMIENRNKFIEQTWKFKIIKKIDKLQKNIEVRSLIEEEDNVDEHIKLIEKCLRQNPNNISHEEIDIIKNNLAKAKQLQNEQLKSEIASILKKII